MWWLGSVSYLNPIGFSHARKIKHIKYCATHNHDSTEIFIPVRDVILIIDITRMLLLKATRHCEVSPANDRNNTQHKYFSVIHCLEGHMLALSLSHQVHIAARLACVIDAIKREF
jgi:hypothetical protein